MARVSRWALTLVLVAVALVPSLTPRPAFACSCVSGIPTQAQFDNATAVLAGRVLAIEGRLYSGSYFSIQVGASHVWKGPPKQELTLTTADGGGAACGYNFAVGTDYVIYAYEREGRLDVSSCGATHIGPPTDFELALFGAELPLQSDDGSSEGDLSWSSSILIVVLYAGVPLVVAAVIASAIVWWRAARR